MGARVALAGLRRRRGLKARTTVGRRAREWALAGLRRRRGLKARTTVGRRAREWTLAGLWRRRGLKARLEFGILRLGKAGQFWSV